MFPSVTLLRRRIVFTMTRSISSAVKAEESDVLFSEHGKRAVITLNRTKQLNALNLDMVNKIYPKLRQWKSTKELIVLEGSGTKAFCAGGDVVSITKDKSGKVGKEFFRAEYLNNGIINKLESKIVALISGIVMGGGVGLSIHGRYRIATETSLFAMPETLIGLFPDVGAAYRLSRMPGSLGMFLTLTGHRLKGPDVYLSGIATHFCHTSLLPDLRCELLSEDKDYLEAIEKYHSKSICQLPSGKLPEFSLTKHGEVIEKCFSAPSVEEIIERLKASGCEFSKQQLNALSTVSPTSLKVTFKQIKTAAALDPYEVLNMDYRLGCRMLEASDFYEGVRAQLIDKDKAPKWKPRTLAEISEEDVNKYFLSLGKEELNLPAALEL